MIELFPEGFEELEHDGDVELAAYARGGDEERFWQVFGPGPAVPIPSGWEDAWKRFHRPIRIGALWVGPPWEEPDADAVAVVIDPGRAFGTGAHATTRLCLELLLEQPPASLLDVGCGSGVLAIAGAKLGFAPVTALDTDPDAVVATNTNAASNAVELTVAQVDAAVDELPEADVAVANVTAAAVAGIAPRLRARTLIASGYLAPEAPRPPGWNRVERRSSGGWVADVFAAA